MAGIYAIRCIKNDKYYIGQTKGNFNGRFNCHRCDLRKNKGIQKLQLDWNLYGEKSFEFIILKVEDDKKKRNELEKKFIDYYDSIENGYNTSTGGIGEGNFGFLNGMYGRHHTKEAKELMSKNRKGLTVGAKNGNYGNHDNSKFTLEVRMRMSEKQKERWKKYRENKNK